MKRSSFESCRLAIDTDRLQEDWPKDNRQVVGESPADIRWDQVRAKCFFGLYGTKCKRQIFERRKLSEVGPIGLNNYQSHFDV